jgi:hypothetical protein
MTYKCPRCGADNAIVNQCGCDPNNLPTSPRIGVVRLSELGTKCWLPQRFCGGRCQRVMTCKYPVKKGCKAVETEIEYLRQQKVVTQQECDTRLYELSKSIDDLHKEGKMEHTPIPWEVDTHSPPHEGMKGMICVRACDSPMNSCLASIGTDEEAKANADFIVRACNSHEELLAALQACINVPVLPDIGHSREFIDAINKAQAAIAKATP